MWLDHLLSRAHQIATEVVNGCDYGITKIVAGMSLSGSAEMHGSQIAVKATGVSALSYHSLAVNVPLAAGCEPNGPGPLSARMGL